MLGTLLHTAALQRNLSQSAIARLSGQSTQTVAACIQGRGNLTSYQTICEHMGLRLECPGTDHQWDIGRCLAEARVQKGITQRAIAKRLGVTHPAIANLERNGRGRVETLSDYLKLLGIKPRLKPGAGHPLGSVSDRLFEIADVLAPNSVDRMSARFLVGDALETIRQFPSGCIDTAMTSPPYFGLRQYEAGGIGEETSLDAYVDAVLLVLAEVHRVLRPEGSLWLNLGDSYCGKSLLGIPWLVAHRLRREQGWFVRNDVIWYKPKGAPDNAEDRLLNRHEHLFHLTKSMSYFYDIDAIRTAPADARSRSKPITTATGISRSTYSEQIEASSHLNEDEKRAALSELDMVLAEVASGLLNDFRMVLRGSHRPTHSDNQTLSSRAKSLKERGFYFLRYNPKGGRPGDVWSISPESSRGRGPHFAPYPEELCRIPILATCPEDGIILDPFCGSGTTNAMATKLGRRSIGIDLSASYIAMAKERCNGSLPHG